METAISASTPCTALCQGSKKDGLSPSRDVMGREFFPIPGAFIAAGWLRLGPFGGGGFGLSLGVFLGQFGVRYSTQL